VARVREDNSLAVESSLVVVRQTRASNAFRAWLRVQADRLAGGPDTLSAGWQCVRSDLLDPQVRGGLLVAALPRQRGPGLGGA
jgi:hypothetical protein